MFQCLMVLLLAAWGCSAPQDGKTLVVGLQSGYPPYEYVDETGKVVGFDVDVAQKMADAMGKKLVIQEMGFDSLILSLKNRKIDVIISGMSITEDRLKEINMVPYLGDKVTHLELLFWEKPAVSMESLKGKKVAVQSGTMQAEFLSSCDGIEASVLENIQELVMDIKYGKSAAMLVDPAIASELKHKYTEIQSMDVPLAPGQQMLGNGIGIAKDNPELKEKIEKIVLEMKESGQIGQLQKGWFHGN